MTLDSDSDTEGEDYPKDQALKVAIDTISAWNCTDEDEHVELLLD